MSTTTKTYKPGTAAGRWFREHLVLILGLLVLLYTFIPIFVVVLMSFNDPTSRLIYRFDGFTLHNWLNPCEPEGMCEALKTSIEIGFCATLGSTVLGHPDRLRPGPARVRRPVGDEPADLPADGVARDRDGLLAAGALRGRRVRRPARLLDDPDRAHHVLHLVRGRHRPGATSGPRRQPRTGGDGSLCHATTDVLAGHLPAGLPGHPRRRAAELLAVLRRLHRHQPERRQHDDVPDVSSGVSRNAASRCRSTWSAP